MPQLTQVRYRYEVSSREEKKRTGSVLKSIEKKTDVTVAKYNNSNGLLTEQTLVKQYR